MIYRDALNIPQPIAQITNWGGKYGRGGYFSLSSTVSAIRGRRWDTIEAAEDDLIREGWCVIERGKDGYGAAKLTIKHTDTAAELDRIMTDDADKWAKATPCYIRYGHLPEGGRSKNHGDGTYEAGVSVFHGQILPTGETRALPNGPTDFCTMVSVQDRPRYVVTGQEIGVGSDGEPLLKNCRIVRP